MKHIVVIGCGVSGLTTGIRLLEEGIAVTIWTRDLPHDTVSAVAAAVWYPYRAFPEEKTKVWAKESYTIFQHLADDPSCGVTVREGIEYLRTPPNMRFWHSMMPAFTTVSDPADLPAGVLVAHRFETLSIDMSVYLDFLMNQFQKKGGCIEQRVVTRLEEAFELTDIVVNCSGLGAQILVPDSSIQPIRGQMIQVQAPDVERFILDEENPGGITYIVPRSRDCVLGGTFEVGNDNMKPDEYTAHAIFARCCQLEPKLKNAKILAHRVGLRPGRPTIRVEKEIWAPGKILIHNYGHAGSGVTLSWGCAENVVKFL